MARASSEANDKIGPGLIVLIVGPSGAGKDALLDGAAALLTENSDFEFPKRIVSRSPHGAEAHDQADFEDMLCFKRDGAYAVTWQAHGLMYALPVGIDDAVRANKCVVFNASRTVTPLVQARFAHVAVIYIDAPAKLRAERLDARGRETVREIEARLSREVSALEPEHADTVIVNDDNVDAGIAALREALEQTWRKTRTESSPI